MKNNVVNGVFNNTGMIEVTIDWKRELLNKVHTKECPNCKGKDLGVDNWGMFKGKSDWFYFCKKCDCTF